MSVSLDFNYYSQISGFHEGEFIIRLVLEVALLCVQRNLRQAHGMQKSSSRSQPVPTPFSKWTIVTATATRIEGAE